MSLYNLRLLAPNKYQMAKFDSDFNLDAVYNLEPKGHSFTCDCPANLRSVVIKPCKHKRMLPLMLGAVNTDRFYDPDTRTWCEPLGDLTRPEAGNLEERKTLADVPMGELSSTEAAVMQAVAGEAVHDEGNSGGKSEALTAASYTELPADADVAEEFSKLLSSAPKPTQAPTIRRR